MSRPLVLDLAHPLRSFREGAKLTQVELAKARGVSQSAQSQSEKIDGGVSLDLLIEAARAAGYVLEIRARRLEEGTR